MIKNEMLESELNVEKAVSCEKCGEEVGEKLFDDEIVAYCKECHWVTH